MSRKRSMRQIGWEISQGICCLCGYPMHLDSNGPLAYTLEHVIPKSRGGANDETNVDGSHQFCNQMKNGSLMEELPKEFRRFLRWKIRNFIANQKPQKDV